MNTRRLVILAGGSSGIGKEILSKLLADGYAVLNLSRRRPVIEVSVDAELLHHTIDLSNPNFSDGFVAQLDNLKQHDFAGMIYCAGIGQIKHLGELSDREVVSTINVNLTSAIVLTKHLLPYLNKASSKVYFLGSRSRRFAFAGGISYCASKAALHSVADSLALECRSLGWNIGVTVFEFGTVSTGFAKVPLSDEHIQPVDAADLILRCFELPISDFDLRVIEVVPSVARSLHG
jgi:NAD(P)-dependent dehydrogenase (short-subunit alcohol dehydrogenase family)